MVLGGPPSSENLRALTFMSHEPIRGPLSQAVLVAKPVVPAISVGNLMSLPVGHGRLDHCLPLQPEKEEEGTQLCDHDCNEIMTPNRKPDSELPFICYNPAS